MGSISRATVNSEEVAAYAATLPNVAVARDYMYMCSDPGQEMIRQDIRDYGLNRVVVASCSPRMHEVTFRHVIEDAGLNPYYFEMANIREQCSWVHTDIEISTEKAKELVAGAMAKVSLPRGAPGARGERYPRGPGHRRRDRRATGGARHRRRRAQGLPGGEAAQPGRAHGPAQQDVPPPGGRRHAGARRDGAGHGAPQHRGAGLQRGGQRRGLHRQLPGHRRPQAALCRSRPAAPPAASAPRRACWPARSPTTFRWAWASARPSTGPSPGRCRRPTPSIRPIVSC